jgi:Phosphorylase superfamily.
MSEILQPHIRLSSKNAAKYALLPGDPGRVTRIADYLENVKELSHNREYYCISGTYRGIEVMAVSTGIGGPSTGIAVEELSKIGVKTLIRIGSCGALQSDLKKGDLIIASGAVRDEGTSRAYISTAYPAIPDTDVLFALIESARRLGYPFRYGLIRSHDSFYVDEEDEIDDFWRNKGILGADMESAALFVIGGLRGLKTGSVLNVITEYRGDLKEDINQYAEREDMSMEGERREILTALEAFVRIDRMNT